MYFSMEEEGCASILRVKDNMFCPATTMKLPSIGTEGKRELARVSLFTWKTKVRFMQPGTMQFSWLCALGEHCRACLWWRRLEGRSQAIARLICLVGIRKEEEEEKLSIYHISIWQTL